MDIYEIIKNQTGVVAITGAAGSGKTTLCKYLCKNIDNSISYSADFAFIGDSQYRKELLNQKQKYSLDHLIDACNQYNWWNWEQIENTINKFINEGKLENSKVYDRDTGKMVSYDNSSENNTLLIYEGAILGSDAILNKINKIFFLNCSSKDRLKRLIEKDNNRRSVQEIAARFLITEYSEILYYKYLFEHYDDKITVIDNNGNLIPLFNKEIFAINNFYLPIKINT